MGIRKPKGKGQKGREKMKGSVLRRLERTEKEWYCSHAAHLTKHKSNYSIYSETQGRARGQVVVGTCTKCASDRPYTIARGCRPFCRHFHREPHIWRPIRPRRP